MHVFLLYKMQIFHFHFSKLHFCARRFSGTFVWYVWVCEEFSEFSTAMLDSNEFHGFWMFLYCRIVRSSKIRWFKIGKIYQHPLEQFPNRTRMDSQWIKPHHLDLLVDMQSLEVVVAEGRLLDSPWIPCQPQLVTWIKELPMVGLW